MSFEDDTQTDYSVKMQFTKKNFWVLKPDVSNL